MKTEVSETRLDEEKVRKTLKLLTFAIKHVKYFPRHLLVCWCLQHMTCTMQIGGFEE
jgi:hypothetical protein